MLQRMTGPGRVIRSARGAGRSCPVEANAGTSRAWEEGHPEHWRDIIENWGFSRPPELHEVELGGCKWCGRHDH